MNQSLSLTAGESFKYSPGFSLFQELRPASGMKVSGSSELIKSKLQKLRKDTLLSLLAIQENYKSASSRLIPSKFASASSFFPRSPSNRTESRKQDLLKYYNQITSYKISETETKLSRYWKSRINNLLLTLKEKQAQVFTEEKSKESQGDANKNRVLVDFTKTLTEQLEERYKKQHTKDLERMKKESNKEKIKEFVSSIEKKHFKALQDEKQAFITKFKQEKQADLSFEEQEYLIEYEKTLKSQANEEVKQTLNSLLQEYNKALQSRFLEIDEHGADLICEQFESESQQWESELKQEKLYASRQDQITKQTQQIKEKIQQELKENLATLAIGKQDKLYEQVHLELFTDFEAFRKQIEAKTREKTWKIEENFQQNFCKQIYSQAEKEVRPIEIKLKMNYHKRLDNLKESLKKDMEKKFSVQYKNFKRTVELEKIAFCQFRANYNVYNKNLEKELKSQHSMKVKERSLLKRKTSEPSIMKLENSREKSAERMRKSGEVGKKTGEMGGILMKTGDLSQKSLDFDVLKVISRPLPHPDSNLITQKAENFSLNTENQSRQGSHRLRIISPSLTEEFFANLLGTQSEANKSQVRSASMTRCQSANLEKTQKRYEELLEKQYKFIRPRNK